MSIFHWKDFSVRKKILIVVIFLFLLLLGFGLAFYFIDTDDVILKHDLSCNFREEVYVKDFIKSMDGQLIGNPLIDTEEVGRKEIKIQYRNRYGFFKMKVFYIEVKDVVAPTVVVANPYVVEKGSVSNLIDTIFCADDYDDEVSCKIDGEYDLNKKGTYDLTITASDHSGNSTSREFSLQVVEKEKSSSPKPSKEEYTEFENIYQKYKSDHTMIGLDISKWQQDVDFAKLKEQGVSFVMLKIGGQTRAHGNISMDPKFKDNIEEALRNDLKVGIYFYSYATSITDAVKQAKWVIENLDGYNITLPVAFDWENWSSYTTFHLSFHSLNQIARAFIEEIEKNQYSAMLYSSKYYLENIWYQEDYTKWLAYYTNHNDYDQDYLMWQLCSDGKIDGIDGYVDIDVMYLT